MNITKSIWVFKVLGTSAVNNKGYSKCKFTARCHVYVLVPPGQLQTLPTLFHSLKNSSTGLLINRLRSNKYTPQSHLRRNREPQFLTNNPSGLLANNQRRIVRVCTHILRANRQIYNKSVLSPRTIIAQCTHQPV